MILWCVKSWNQNIEVVKRHLSETKINKLYSQFKGSAAIFAAGIDVALHRRFSFAVKESSPS